MSSSSTQVLLNGVPEDHIHHRRGLWQGDPLSPMLFILVMDVLGHMITKATSEGLLLPLSSRGLQHRISIYADDVALFLRPKSGDITTTMDILNLFGEASGSGLICRKVMCFRSGVLIWRLQPYETCCPALFQISHANT
jgi:hypothetical protein